MLTHNIGISAHTSTSSVMWEESSDFRHVSKGELQSTASVLSASTVHGALKQIQVAIDFSGRGRITPLVFSRKDFFSHLLDSFHSSVLPGELLCVWVCVCVCARVGRGCTAEVAKICLSRQRLDICDVRGEGTTLL